MNDQTIPAKVKRWHADRRVVWGGVMAIAVTAGITLLLAAEQSDRGDNPYTPRKAEWLCLTLNVEEAIVANKSPGDVAIRYVYDPQRPDTVLVVANYPPRLVGPQAVRVRTERAQNRVLEEAKRRGWDSWLKVEFRVLED